MLRLSKRQRYGLKAELWAVEQLTKRGYDALLLSNFSDKVDILVNNRVPCEVKIRHKYMRKVREGYYKPTWLFEVGRSSHFKDSLFILICDDGVLWHPFIVPSWYFFGRATVSITSHPTKYAGRLADCLNCWGNVADVLSKNKIYSYQLPLEVLQ